MKKIGIIFAMKEELDELLKIMSNKKKHSISNLTIYECICHNCICYLVESGIGKVNAARTTQIMIDKLNIDEIINVGVAGSVSPNLKVGDIVIGNKLIQHDFNLIAFGRKRGEIPDIGLEIPVDKKLLKAFTDIKEENTHKGIIASGDIFIEQKEKAIKIYNNFNALCVEMEGAAIAQVCFLSKIPFIILRAISDSVTEGNNKKTYEEFLEGSSKKIAQFVNKYLEKQK